MSEQFDPYYEWLGIKPADQPPNRYQLLGVETFESDPVALRRAADERMTYVRTFATGRHAKLTQKILNELAAAKVCLLDDNKRADYDETLTSTAPPPPTATESGSLRPSTAPGPPVPPAPPPAAPPVAISETAVATEVATQDQSDDGDSQLATVAPRTGSYPLRRRRSKSGAGGILFGAAIAVMLVVGGIAAMNLAGKPSDVSLDDGGGGSTVEPTTDEDDPSATDAPPEDFQPAPPTEQQPEKLPSRRPNPRLPVDLPAEEPSKPLLEEPWPDPIRLPDRDLPQPRVQQPKQPVPDAAELQQALRQLDDSLNLQAPRPADEKLELARKLFDESLLRDSTVERFVLLEQARRLAVDGGDLQTALEAVQQQDRHFEIDELAVLTDVVTSINFPAGSPGNDHLKLALVGLQLIDQTVAADRFELADRITSGLGPVIARADAPELSQKLQDAIRQTRLVQRPYEQAQAALDTLAGSPDDPAASTMAGRYYCFVKGDWKNGLPYLANGNHAEQRELSERELAEAQKPDDAIEIADGWLAMADDDEAFLPASVALQKENLLRHALALYQRNVTRLPESKRRHAESQIEDLTRQLAGGASPVKVSRAIWYMQDVSMKPFPVGQRGDLRQTTDDPRAPFRGQGVYFDQSGRRDDLVFRVDWDKRVRSVKMTVKNLKNFRVQCLSFDGQRVISQSSRIRSSRELQTINFTLPSNVGSRFCLHLHNEADGWFYLDSIELNTTS